MSRNSFRFSLFFILLSCFSFQEKDEGGGVSGLKKAAFGILENAKMHYNNPLKEKDLQVLTEARKLFLNDNQYQDYLQVSLQIADHYDLLFMDSSVVGILNETQTDLTGKIDPESYDLARLYNKIGLSFSYLQQFGQSETQLLKAYRIFQKNIGKDPYEAAKNCRSVSKLYENKEDYFNARKYLDKAFDILDSYDLQYLSTQGISIDSVKAYYYLQSSLLCDFMKDYDLGNITTQKGLNLSKKFKDKYLNGHLYMLGGIFAEHQKQYLSAIDYYEKAISNLSQNQHLLATCYENAAISYRKMNKPQEAFLFLNKAVNTFQSLLPQGNPSELMLEIARSEIENARTFLQIGDLKNAKLKAQKSLEIRNGLTNTVDVAESYTVLGDIAFAEKDYQKAVDDYQAAVQKLIPNFKPAQSVDCPRIADSYIVSPFDLLDPLFSKTKCLELMQPNEHEQVIQHYLVIDSLIAKMRNSYSNEGSKYFLADTSRTIYNRAINTAIEYSASNPKYAEIAFRFSARNKSILLAETLHDDEIKSYSGIPAELIEEERTLKANMTKLEREIAQNEFSENTKSIYDSLSILYKSDKERFKKNQEKIAREYPEYTRLKNNDDNLPAIEQIQQKLKSDEAMMEYFEGTTNTYTFVITKHNVKAVALNPDATTSLQLEKYRRTVSDYAYNMSKPQEADRDYFETAFSLFQTFIEKPFSTLGNEAADIKSLTVIPDGQLGYIPFEAFLTQKTTDWNQSPPFLIKKYCVRYLYFASQLLSDNDRKTSASNPFIAYTLDYRDEATARSLNDSTVLATLDFSTQKARLFAESQGGVCKLNEAATKDEFIKQAAGNSKIIHIAAHGVLDNENPEASGFVFFKNTSKQDNILRISDIYGLDLNADLVVLGSCNSANGNYKRSEGVMSMARAFLFARCPSLVASLWSLPDREGYEILDNFYKEIKEKEYAPALQAAKLNFIESAFSTPGKSNSVKPCYWAGLVFTGANNPPKNDFPWIWVSAAGLFLLLLCVPYIKNNFFKRSH